VEDLMTRGRPYVILRPGTTARELLRHVSETTWQDVFPVADGAGAVVGGISADALRLLAVEQQDTAWLVAADIMAPAVTLLPQDNLRTATERMVASGLRELPVVDAERHILGFLDETDIAQTYLRAAVRNENSSGERSSELWIPRSQPPR